MDEVSGESSTVNNCSRRLKVFVRDGVDTGDGGSTGDGSGTVGSIRGCSDCPEMILISNGTFQMGNLETTAWKYDMTVHSMTVPSFKIGKYEVTFDEWHACVMDGGCLRVDVDGYEVANPHRGRTVLEEIRVTCRS